MSLITEAISVPPFDRDPSHGAGHDPSLGENGAIDAPISTRLLAEGDGWRAQEVVCRSGPTDPRFEEQHAWTSVAAVLSGVFTYRSRHGRAVLAPGALLLGDAEGCFECGHEHGVGDRCVSVHLSPALVDDVLSGLDGRGRRPGFRRAGAPPLDRLAPLTTLARALTRNGDPLLAEQLALDLAATAFSLDQDAGGAASRISEEARAVEAARIIEARYTEPLTIAGLAEEVGLKRRRFATAFHGVIGVTPYNYVLGRRLEAAAERLRAGATSVLDVALDVGFGDLSEFTRRFSSRFGTPPGLYRRQARS
jgi:AraC family transcriptional regulator